MSIECKNCAFAEWARMGGKGPFKLGVELQCCRPNASVWKTPSVLPRWNWIDVERSDRHPDNCGPEATFFLKEPSAFRRFLNNVKDVLS